MEPSLAGPPDCVIKTLSKVKARNVAKAVGALLNWANAGGIGLAAFIVLFALFVLYLRLFSGKTYFHTASPDGKYIAQWRKYCSFAAATDSCTDSIELKERYNPFRHTVLEALRRGR